MNARFQVFRGALISWHDLFSQAAHMASLLGPERVISISHSEDANEGVVVVWYWDDGQQATDTDFEITA